MKSSFEISGEDVRTAPASTLENVIEKTLEDLSTSCAAAVRQRVVYMKIFFVWSNGACSK